MTPREEERRRLFAEADGVSRADAKLRTFGRRVGGAIMCRRCDGDGIVLRATGWLGLERLIEPFKCPTCNGEGLDPDSVPRTRR